jgi:AcrR family transcriptional regulator|tara:strand:- start:175403 stop:176089 length:687 start_codon:yes stop_codon:yes gene_type:complete
MDAGIRDMNFFVHLLTIWLNYIVNMKKSKNENTEEQILEAAKIVFQAKGMNGARMQEIADEAGINKAMLHYYYRSKQLLFEAVFKQAFSLLAPQLNTILNDDSSIEDKIRNFTSNYTSFMMKHPYLPNFIIQELNRNEDFILKLKDTTGFPNLEKFKLKVDEEINQGVLVPIDADQLFVNIISLNIFPFLGKPLIKAFTNKDDSTYKNFLESRKTEVANFIVNSIKPL